MAPAEREPLTLNSEKETRPAHLPLGRRSQNTLVSISTESEADSSQEVPNLAVTLAPLDVRSKAAGNVRLVTLAASA